MIDQVATARPATAPHLCVAVTQSNTGIVVSACCPIDAFISLSSIHAIANRKRVKLALTKGAELEGMQHYSVSVPSGLLGQRLTFEALATDGTLQDIWIPKSLDVSLPQDWTFSRYHLLLRYRDELARNEGPRCYLQAFSVGTDSFDATFAFFSPPSASDPSLIISGRDGGYVEKIALSPSGSDAVFGIPAAFFERYSQIQARTLTVSVPSRSAFPQNDRYELTIGVESARYALHFDRLSTSQKSGVHHSCDESASLLACFFPDPPHLEVFRLSTTDTERVKALQTPQFWEGEVPVWLLGDGTERAWGNGWALFQYLRANHPEIDARYVVANLNERDASPAVDGIVAYGSIEHLEVCQRAEAVLFSGRVDHVFPRLLQVLSPTSRAPVTHYLQREVLAVDATVPSYGKMSSYDLFSVSSARERSLVTKRYGWPADRVAESGLARWDEFARHNAAFLARNEAPSRMLVVPTASPQDSYLTEEDFKQSAICKTWREVIINLENSLSAHGVEIDVCLGEGLERYSAAFDPANVISMLEVAERLPAYSVLITDYSSLCYDFLYLNKPTIFFLDAARASRMKLSYAELASELPGPMVETSASLIQTVWAVHEGRIAQGADREKFVTNDTKNCARAVELTLRKIAERVATEASRALGAEDYIAVERASRFFLNEGAKPIFDRNVLGIYATAIEARLMTGHIAGATTALRQAQRQYGKSSELSTVTALIDHIHGNDNAAIAALDIGFYSLPVEAASKSDVLVATKAGFLAKAGEIHKARSLIAANIDKVHSERIFECLADSVADGRELSVFEDIVLPKLSNFGTDYLYAMRQYALLLVRLGDVERAITIARECFLTLTRRRAFGLTKKEQLAGPQKTAAALADLTHSLRDARVRPFLVARTLLRSARGEPIGGQIDLGISETASLQNLSQALAGSMRFEDLPREEGNLIAARHLNGCTVNVYRHYLRGGQMIRESSNVRWSNTPFSLTTIDTLGGQYDVPSDMEQYLFESYGDWRRPKADFDDLIDSQNMTVRRGRHMIVHYLLYAAEVYLLGLKTPLDRTRIRLAALYPEDRYLHTVLKEIVANPAVYQKPSQPVSTKKIVVAKPAAKGATSPSRPSSSISRLSGTKPEFSAISLPSLLPLDESERMEANTLWFLPNMLRSKVNGRYALLEARKSKELMDALPGNASLRQRFTRAAIAAGHGGIKAGQYEDACRVYFSMLTNAIGDKSLVHRNLASAALKGARQAEAAGRKQEAGMFWRYLLVANPESSTARQGVMRCAVVS